MSLLLVALSSLPITYAFRPETPMDYDVRVRFEGFIPILGGQQGVVEVKMDLRVVGAPESDGTLRASSELRSVNITFNGVSLPLTLDNVVEFFPKTTVTMTPFGKVRTTDAPDKVLPVKLPGLDSKRFPDITYLPIEFPEAGIELNRAFEFTKAFGSSPVVYTATPDQITESTVRLAVVVRQDYTVLENESVEVVATEAEAIRRVKTEVRGSGVVHFDRKVGALGEMSISATAASEVIDLKTQEKAQRELKTLLEVRRRTPAWKSPTP